MNKMKVLDYTTLMTLNDSSIRVGRNQNLRPDRLASKPRDRYWITDYKITERTGQQEIRICVVLSVYAGQTAWLDVSSEEFEAIPEIDVSEDEWEVALCAGTPPPVQ